MPGQSQLYLNILKLDSKFQSYLHRKRGNTARLKQLRLGLLQTLETGEKNKQLTKVTTKIYGAKTLRRKVIKTVENGCALPKAIYDHIYCGTGLKRVCSDWGCKVSDMNAAKKLAVYTGRKLGSFTQEKEFGVRS